MHGDVRNIQWKPRSHAAPMARAARGGNGDGATEAVARNRPAAAP